MVDAELVVESDAPSSLIDQLGKALLELNAYKDTSEDRVQWTEIEEHFRNLETTLKKKFEELEAKEMKFAELEAETCTFLVEREAAVTDKEQDLLDRVQELKDAAVAAIAEARVIHQPTTSGPLDDGDNKNSKLAESYPLVPLLKTYLKDLRRNSQGDNLGDASGAQDDVNAKELAALKAVIRCVKEYKLEADYPLDPLQKRVLQLERSKADKKRSGEGKRLQLKRQKTSGKWRGYRGPGGGGASAPTAGRHGQPVFSERAAYGGIPERYALAGARTYDYQVPSQPAYAPQANDQRLYYYRPDDRVPPASYNATPSNYGSYAGSGLQSQHQPYM